MSSTLGRIALYLTLGVVALVALLSFSDLIEDGNEARERLAVEHALRWHKSYVIARDSVRKSAQRAESAMRVSRALRDSVRVVSDTTVVIQRDTIVTPRVIIRRLVADSVTISRLTLLTDVQGHALVVADSTIAAYQAALEAAQANRCRLFWRVPCPSRKTTALLTAGGLLVVKLTIGAAL